MSLLLQSQNERGQAGHVCTPSLGQRPTHQLSGKQGLGKWPAGPAAG